MQFGRRSEKLDPDQFNLALEDLEQAVAASEAEQDKADPTLRKARSENRRAGWGALPEHLLRVEIVVEPEDAACPCCGSAMHVIGEDRSQRVDVDVDLVIGYGEYITDAVRQCYPAIAAKCHTVHDGSTLTGSARSLDVVISDTDDTQ